MGNQTVGLDVTSEFAKVKAHIEGEERYPGWLMDEVSGYAFFILDRDGRVIHWNQGAMRLTGYAAEEIIGQDFSCLYDSGETQMHQIPQFCMGIAGRLGFYENKAWWVRHDGSHFLAEVMIMHIGTNGGGFAVMVWDISKNKGAASEMDEHHHKTSPFDE